jgi:glycosyltransferase involved in cell wall biosynthesis
VVIPAYNEQRRLPQTLSKVQHYLAQQPYAAEILVVDDGSDDATADLAEQQEGVRVLRRPHRGKGFAVRSGALEASGDYLLLCDADLATPIEEWHKLWPYFEQGYQVVIGSREGMSAERIGEPWYRHMMGRVFNLLVRTVALSGIQDTQCGFKALPRAVARDLFQRVHIYGDNAPTVQGAAVTAYDVELLFLARRCGYQIAEVPVIWHYGEETKVDPLRDSLRNLRDVLQVRLNDWRGIYRCDKSPASPPPSSPNDPNDPNEQ